MACPHPCPDGRAAAERSTVRKLPRTGDPQTVEFSVEHFQPFLELVQFFPVFRLLKALCQVRFCKDPFFISVRRVPYLLVLRKFLARAASGELGYFLMSSFMRALAAAFWFILLKQMPCFR